MTKTALIGAHEDNKIIGVLMGRLLETLGYNHTTVYHIDEVLQKMDIPFDGEAVPFDLVAMEMNLGKPGSNDYTPLRIINQLPTVQTGITKLLGYSGLPDIVNQANQEGLICIGKPFTQSELVAAIGEKLPPK